eukprot:scaffold7595_cov49-Cyclotella_meneghiniana.AAC.8
MSYQKDVWLCNFRRPDVNNMRKLNVRKTEYLNVGPSGCRAKRTSGCVFLDVQIWPTTNARTERNAINKSRSTSTTVDYVEQSYNVKELRQVNRTTTAEWKQTYPNVALPYKRTSDRKKEFATLICRMRERFIADNPRWASTTEQLISQQITEEEAAIAGSISERMAEFNESRYMSLCINVTNNTEVQALRDAYSTKYLKSNPTTNSTAGTIVDGDDLAELLSFDL